jgi:cysteinyl-tRNA synthetase
MDIQLYNTLSKKKETFKPLRKGAVTMYSCGPTVYDRIHIGNFRAAIFPDILKRVFEYNGYKVKHVVNVTDIGHLVSDGDEGEDKMTKALRREKMPITLESMREIGTKYFNQYVADLKELNVKLPEGFPRASDHIAEDVELIKKIETKGFTYKIGDGLYFDTRKLPSYGKLGNVSTENRKNETRIIANPEKKNPTDFALWKFDDKLGWDGPWGKGFPGWHIECSAMSTKYLGQPFDIHTGAIDLVPVHHNNEIAQSEAAFDKKLANYWMHNEFLTVDNAKMSKSAGNYITLQTLKDELISPLAYRYWLLTAHYRSPVSFTYNAVKAAQNALIRLISTVSAYDAGGAIIPDYKERFQAFINDDLDLPRAVALTWDLLKDDKYSNADKRATILDFDRVFGLNVEAVRNVADEEISEEITALAEVREQARKTKDWKKADTIRLEIENRGFIVRDTDSGFRIQRK